MVENEVEEDCDEVPHDTQESEAGPSSVGQAGRVTVPGRWRKNSYSRERGAGGRVRPYDSYRPFY